MRAYFAGSSVPTPEEMGMMLPSPQPAAVAQKLESLVVAGKKRVKKKSAPAGVLRTPLPKKQL